MIHPAPSLSGLDAGCSAMSWETADQRHLWGRNFDFQHAGIGQPCHLPPRGTCYAVCDRTPQNRFRSAYAAVGTGLLSVSLSPLLYEGINDRGTMGGQLYYRELACYEGFPRPGTTPLQPPVPVYHLLAQCATVAEVVHALREEITLLDTPLLGTVPPLHWSFSDRTGEAIVVEPDRDGLHIYRDTLGVMTNSPDYPRHRTNLLNYAGIRDWTTAPWSLQATGRSPASPAAALRAFRETGPPLPALSVWLFESLWGEGTDRGGRCQCHVPPSGKHRLPAGDGTHSRAGVPRQAGRRCPPPMTIPSTPLLPAPNPYAFTGPPTKIPGYSSWISPRCAISPVRCSLNWAAGRTSGS